MTRLLPEWWILVAMIYWEWALFKNPSGAYCYKWDWPATTPSRLTRRYRVGAQCFVQETPGVFAREPIGFGRCTGPVLSTRLSTPPRHARPNLELWNARQPAEGTGSVEDADVWLRMMNARLGFTERLAS